MTDRRKKPCLARDTITHVGQNLLSGGFWASLACSWPRLDLWQQLLFPVLGVVWVIVWERELLAAGRERYRS